MDSEKSKGERAEECLMSAILSQKYMDDRDWAGKAPIPVDVRAREAPGAGLTLREFAPGTRALVGVEEKGRQVGGYHRVVSRLAEEVGL